MNSSRELSPSTEKATPKSAATDLGVAELRELRLGGDIPVNRSIDLRDLGFDYRVSDEARAEIAKNERRALRVLETAHKYWFGGRRG